MKKLLSLAAVLAASTSTIAFADGQVQQSDDAGLQEAMRQNAELVGGKADSPTAGENQQITRGSWW